MSKKWRGRLYRWLWLFIRPLIPRKIGDGTRLEHYRFRMSWQLILSQLFGGPDVLIFGDSNAEKFSGRRDLSKMEEFGVVVNIGVGGTRAEQWVEFFSLHEIGRILYKHLGKAPDVFISAGGNNVIQRTMHPLADALVHLRAMFPSSVAVTPPPIHYSLLEAIGLPAEVTKEGIRTVTNYIKAGWGGRVIDTYEFFKGPSGEALAGALSDPVHYSNLGGDFVIAWMGHFIRAREASGQGAVRV